MTPREGYGRTRAGPTSLDVAHVNDAAGFKKHCADKGGLCAIAMLNGAPSADAEREAQVGKRD